VCHCFVEAVLAETALRNTASAKQWHTVLRNAGYKIHRGIASGNRSDDEMAFTCFYNLMKYALARQTGP
jgi:hypothetical protein